MWKQLQIGTDMLLIITSTGRWSRAFLSTPMILNDLEPPKRVSSEFFAILAAAHISRVNCDEMPKIDRNNLQMKVSDFSSPSADPLGSRRSAHVLLLLPRLAWKQLQIGTDVMLMIISTSDELLRSANIDDLEWPWTPNIVFLVFFCDFGLWHTF